MALGLPVAGEVLAEQHESFPHALSGPDPRAQLYRFSQASSVLEVEVQMWVMRRHQGWTVLLLQAGPNSELFSPSLPDLACLLKNTGFPTPAWNSKTSSRPDLPNIPCCSCLEHRTTLRTGLTRWLARQGTWQPATAVCTSSSSKCLLQPWTRVMTNSQAEKRHHVALTWHRANGTTACEDIKRDLSRLEEGPAVFSLKEERVNAVGLGHPAASEATVW